MDSQKKAIIKKIKDTREANAVTQAEVAKRADINVNYYARLERGEENPSMDVLLRIAKALKMKSSDILGF